MSGSKRNPHNSNNFVSQHHSSLQRTESPFDAPTIRQKPSSFTRTTTTITAEDMRSYSHSPSTSERLPTTQEHSPFRNVPSSHPSTYEQPPTNEKNSPFDAPTIFQPNTLSANAYIHSHHEKSRTEPIQSIRQSYPQRHRKTYPYSYQGDDTNSSHFAPEDSQELLLPQEEEQHTLFQICSQPKTVEWASHTTSWREERASHHHDQTHIQTPTAYQKTEVALQQKEPKQDTPLGTQSFLEKKEANDTFASLSRLRDVVHAFEHKQTDSSFSFFEHSDPPQTPIEQLGTLQTAQQPVVPAPPKKQSMTQRLIARWKRKSKK